MSEGPDPAPVGDPPVAPVPVQAAPAPTEGAPVEGEAPTPSPLGVQPEPSGESTAPAPAEPEPLTAESYQFTLPDGVTLDDASMSTLKDTLATHKVPAEVGQSLIDLHVAALNKSAEAFILEQKNEWTRTTDEWKAAIAADPELGGTKMAEVQSAIGKAFDEYGSAEARQAFDLTGSGWNPHIIKFVYNMAKALSEGSPHPANNPPSNRHRAPADVLYSKPN